MGATITYRVQLGNGEFRQKTGYPTGVPGLIVSRPEPDDPDRTAGTFTVVHARSGAIVSFDFASPEAALAAATALGPLVDWTLPGEAVRAHVNPAAADRIAEEYGGLTRGTAVSDFIDNGVIA
jgi:hypothetical protein